MKFINSIFSLAMLILFFGSALAQQPTAREVMEKYKAQDRTNDSSVELTMTMVNSRGGTRERQLNWVTKTDEKDNRKSLIRFLAPADVSGTGFLSIEHSGSDDDNWLYLPSLRKSRRIAGSDKSDSFMGTEFTYEDLDTEDLNAYEYKLQGSETVDGLEAWVVEAVPVDPKKIEESGYSKRELWIGKDHNLLVQAKYYDKEGRYVKLYQTADTRQIAGTEKWRAYELTMKDVIKGDKTILDITEYKINEGVQDSYFSERYLKRGV
jgi:outer membrane lipoprotein-sorting protein